MLIFMRILNQQIKKLNKVNICDDAEWQHKLLRFPLLHSSLQVAM